MLPQITTNKPGQVRPISIYKPAWEGLSRWVIEWAAHFEGRLPAWGGRVGEGHVGRAGEHWGRQGTPKLRQTFVLLNTVAGCQKGLALFLAQKTEEILELCIDFSWAVGN